jgi:hypothetical protein
MINLEVIRKQMENDRIFVKKTIEECQQALNFNEYHLNRFDIKIYLQSWSLNPTTIYIFDSLTDKEFKISYNYLINGFDYPALNSEFYSFLRKEKIAKILSI